MTRRPASILRTLLVCLWSLPVFAQAPAPADSAASEPPAHVSAVDGAALLERDGRTDTDPLSMPLLAGDRLRTQAGRVEVLFADGSALHLDEQTTVDFQSDEIVRLLAGRVRLSVAGPGRDVAYRIDAPGAWVQISNPGEYRVSLVRGDEVELAVLRGGAELVNEQGRTFVSAGERTYARVQSAPSPAYVFNSAAWDSFDRWAESRRDQRLGISAQYLPEDVRRYAPAFDTYGSWRYEPVYGYVWYPRVQAGWRPYYHGRWASLRPFGWTWIAGDPWGWPTHHYGRWGISAGSWFWIPGRSWAPAWVSWGYAPGYVSWCPLGWNNRPVLAFSGGFYSGRHYDPWYAWSVLPRQHFGVAYVNVSRYPLVRVDPRLHSSFVVNRRGPDVNFAVNRSAVPIHTAGRSAAWRADRAGVADTGGPRTSAAAVGAGDGDRRFPAAARAPGSPIGNASPDRAGVRDRSSARESRELAGAARSADSPPPAAVGSRPRAADARPTATGDESARSIRRGEAPASQPVTAAPPGAVRAVPRMRAMDSDTHGAPVRQLRSYSASPRYEAPSDSAPPAREPRASAPETRYGVPQDRAVTRGSEERGNSREPAYRPRSADGGAERQAPAASPRSEAPAPRSAAPAPRGDGDGAPRGGSGRDRASDGGGTGRAVRRGR
jgi:hypothetical protein